MASEASSVYPFFTRRSSKRSSALPPGGVILTGEAAAPSGVPVTCLISVSFGPRICHVLSAGKGTRWNYINPWMAVVLACVVGLAWGEVYLSRVFCGVDSVFDLLLFCVALIHVLSEELTEPFGCTSA